uniref:RNase H type-1 domain-containing protein n=1 Tax=Manihot esculenta TaxID=3983 RepID=A0A2C9W6D6_MANES
MKRIWKFGRVELSVESDSREIVEIVKGKKIVPLIFRELILSIRSMIRPNLSISVKHVYRETNFCTDRLTKLAATFP